jgi:3-isopropylmalate dehydratase small subunit
MKAFPTLHAVAAPMPDADIDTDIIYPARFLLLTDKAGLGRCAFFDQRFDAAGRERPGFVLNRAPWRQAGVLVVGANFGCGSSREQAAWALADLGFRCLIAPGFGEIFQANCWANGILPIVLNRPQHAAVMSEAHAARPLTVDLRTCTVAFAGTTLHFEVPARQRQGLLEGLDTIGLLLRDEARPIDAFEQAHQARAPWLFAPRGALPSSTP